MNLAHEGSPNKPYVVSLTDNGFVIACALSPGHDSAYRRSRELAGKFHGNMVDLLCQDVALEARGVADCARMLMRSDRTWDGWHLALSIGKCTTSTWQLLNCGTHSVFVWTPNGPKLVLWPQSVARKLREEGIASIPPFAEDIAGTLFGADSPDDAIEAIAIKGDSETAVAVFADWRIAESILSRFADSSWRNTDLRVAVEEAAAALHNPNETFVFHSTPAV